MKIESKTLPLFVNESTYRIGQDIINNHDEWKIEEYEATKNSTSIWIANGVLCLDLRNNRGRIGSFNLFEKIYIMKCLRKCTRLKAAEDIMEKDDSN